MNSTKIYAIGYGNRNWESFLSLLLKYEITTLADIRSNPFSRFNPLFRKAALENGLNQAGIKYWFLGEELGGKPKDANLYANGKLDYHHVEASSLYQRGILKLLESAKQGEVICIMCSELKPENCHRKNLVGKTLTEMGITVIQIDGDGQISTQGITDEGRLF